MWQKHTKSKSGIYTVLPYRATPVPTIQTRLKLTHNLSNSNHYTRESNQAFSLLFKVRG